MPYKGVEYASDCNAVRDITSAGNQNWLYTNCAQLNTGVEAISIPSLHSDDIKSNLW